jgi:hypothetical protein
MFAITYNTMADLLDGTKYESEVRLGKGLFCYIFSRGTTSTAVIWSNVKEPDKNITLNFGSTVPGLEALDMFGNPVASYKSAKSIRLTNCPVYLVASNTSPAALANALSKTTVKGIDLFATDFTVDSGPAVLASVANTGGSIVTQGKVSVWTENLKTANPSVSLQNLKPGEKRPFSFSFSPNQSGELKEKVTLLVSVDKEATETSKTIALFFCKPDNNRFQLNKNSVDYPDSDCLQVNRKDQAVIGTQWQGEADLSGKVWLAWDKDNLYLEAQAQDDTFTPGISTGDAVELFFDTVPQSVLTQTPGFYRKGATQAMFTAVNNVIQAEMNKNSDPAFNLSTVKSSFYRMTGGYLLKAAIPWPNLSPFVPKEGGVLGFDIALDDADNTKTRKTQMVWAGTADNWKDVSQIGRVVLRGN